jgi:hypothetical protein
MKKLPKPQLLDRSYRKPTVNKFCTLMDVLILKQQFWYPKADRVKRISYLHQAQQISILHNIMNIWTLLTIMLCLQHAEQ